MSDYRYLVFPRGKQPTVDEAAEFRNLSGVLAGKVAIGSCRRTGGLVFAIDAAVFSHAVATHRGFANLVEKWEVRGCLVETRLGFVKDAKVLQPVQPNLWSPGDGPPDRSTSFGKRLASKELASKELAAQEAIGRSMLGVRQALDRFDWLQRCAAMTPYMLMALGAAGTIAVGFYVSGRLLDGGMERRRETTERVIENPLGEVLDRR